MSGRNAEGREVREYIAIGPNGGPVQIATAAVGPVPMGKLGMAGLTNISSNTKATASVVSLLQPHGLTTGDTVFFASSDSLPVIDGARVATVIDSTSFSVPVNTSNTNPAATIAAVSQASPAVIDTVAAHNIVNLSSVIISGADAVPDINGTIVATVTDGDSFTIPINTNANQSFVISEITKASPAIVTTTTPHLLKAGSTNTAVTGTDSVPVIDNGARACTYIDATHFSVAVDIPAGQDFNITSASAASPSVFVTAAHLMNAGDTTVTVSGSNRFPDINGVKVATKTAATGFTIPAAATGSVAITSNTAANPSVFTTAAHSLLAGDTTVTVAGTDSVPRVDGAKSATYIDATSFSIPATATPAFTIATATDTNPSIVTTTTPHLLKAGTTNVAITADDAVPTITDPAAVATYIDATSFRIPRVANLQDFNIASSTAAPLSTVTTAAHLIASGTRSVIIAGSDQVPTLNGAHTATYVSATEVTIPSASTQSFTITNISSHANTPVLTVPGGHLLKAGATSVTLIDTLGNHLDGVTDATYIDATTFSVNPFNTTGAGDNGAANATMIYGRDGTGVGTMTWGQGAAAGTVTYGRAGTTGTITYGRAGGATGKINYGRAGTTGAAAYKRAGTTGTVGFGKAGTAATTMQPAITAIGLGASPLITTGGPHGLRTGDTVTTAATDSTPACDDTYTVTYVDEHSFTITPAAPVTDVGTAGKLVKVTYNSDVVDRGGASGGGAIVVTPALGYNTARSVKINLQGSADGTNWFNIPYALVGDPRTFVTTEITLTSGPQTYLLQEQVFWRYARLAFNTSRNIGLTPTLSYIAA